MPLKSIKSIPPLISTGSVDATTLAITLSDPLLVVSDASYGVYASTASLTALSFMLTYYDSGGLSPVLSAQVFTVDITNPAAPVIAAITLVTTKPQSDLGYNLVKTTTLDSSNVVVAYGDTFTGNGITCTLVTYDASTKTILFGSVLPIVTGSTVNNDPNLGFTSLAIVTIGGGSQFMVIFVDLSLNGAVVTAVGEVIKFRFAMIP